MDYKNKILKSDYNFLRENLDIKSTIYLVASGSFGYGTDNKSSDLDLRGITVENSKYIYGIENFQQYENIETDTVIYGLKKFVTLCLNSNPNAIELLGVEDEEIVICTESGKLFRDNSDIFLSKRVSESFGNYAIAQLRRLQNAMARDSYSIDEKEVHIKNSLTKQLQHFNKNYTSFGEDGIKIYLENSKKANLEYEIYFDVNLNHYPIRDFVKIYCEMNNTMKIYDKLNDRNNKKSEKQLFKHAMHLIRLLITGIDILDGKGIITKRRDEHNMLMDIREGKISFEEIYKIVHEYQTLFHEKSKSTKLPEEPDKIKACELQKKIYEINGFVFNK